MYQSAKVTGDTPCPPVHWQDTWMTHKQPENHSPLAVLSTCVRRYVRTASPLRTKSTLYDSNRLKDQVITVKQQELSQTYAGEDSSYTMFCI